jgi:hypothetical protein
MYIIFAIHIGHANILTFISYQNTFWEKKNHLKHIKKHSRLCWFLFSLLTFISASLLESSWFRYTAWYVFTSRRIKKSSTDIPDQSSFCHSEVKKRVIKNLVLRTNILQFARIFFLFSKEFLKSFCFLVSCGQIILYF